MLKTFRAFGNTKASKTMLTLLVVCFSAWGIGDYLTKQIGAEAVTVNGQGLSVNELDHLYQGRMQQLQNLMGGRVAPEVLQQLNLPQVVMTEAVNRAIMRQTASGLGLMPSTEAVRDEIFGMPEFSTEQGFSAEKYQAAVSRSGLTMAAFETSLAQDMSVRLLGDLVKVVAPAPAAVGPLLALDQATYGIETFRLSAGSLGNLPEPTDAQLEAFLIENAKVFMTPEKRDVLVMPIHIKELSKSLDVTNEEIEAYYTANKGLYEVPEKRAVRHILLSSEQEAKDVRGKITSTADLAKLAQEKSLDTVSAKDGGNLGMIAKDEVVQAFGDAAFGLGVGEVSTPVQTPFGWHILVVEKIEPAHTMPLADVREGVVAALKDQMAEDTLFDLQQQVDDKIGEGMTLAEIGKDLGLKVESLKNLEANDETLPKELHAAAFSVQAGEVSAPVEGTDGSMTYVQATSVTPAQDPQLADVRERVTTAFVAGQRITALRERAGALVAAQAKDKNLTLEGAALQAQVAGMVGNVTFSGAADAPEWLHPSLAQLVQVPTGSVLPNTITDGDDVVVVRVSARTITPLEGDKLAAAGKVYAQRLQADYEGMLIGDLSRAAKVKTNPTRLKQVFGEDIAVQVN